jgi:hypothetical protein
VSIVKGNIFQHIVWSATSLYSAIKDKQNSKTTPTTSVDNPTELCPICNKDSVVLIPLQENEAYQMSIGDKEDLKYSFLIEA